MAIVSSVKIHGQDFDNSDFQAQQLLLEPGGVQVIFDVGANVGNTVAAYRAGFPNAHIYAFEPFAPIYEQLATRFADDGRVHPLNLAVGSQRGTRAFYVNEYADTNSLLPRPVGSRRYYAADNIARGSIPVEVTTLDDFSQSQNLLHIDILKLDLQGGEAEALAGAADLLSSSRVDLIFSEVFFVPHYENAWLFHDITRYVAGFGYSLYDLRHLVSGANGQVRFADALYVSERVRKNVIDARPSEP